MAMMTTTATPKSTSITDAPARAAQVATGGAGTVSVLSGVTSSTAVTS